LSSDAGVGPVAPADASVIGDRSACASDADCVARLPPTTPPNCADAICDATAKQCIFRAKDGDGDGYRAASCTAADATPIEIGADCDDTDPLINPGKPERCNNKDDNCNGLIDENIPPDKSQSCTVGLGLCSRVGNKTCNAGQWTGCSATPGVPTPDFPICDGQDHDCDGMPNTGCDCKTGSQQTCSMGECTDSVRTCNGGKWSGCTAVVNRSRYYLDSDGDNYPIDTDRLCPGDPKTTQPGWRIDNGGFQQNEYPECDNDPNRHPGATQICGQDMNCDRQPDVPPGGACNATQNISQGCTFTASCGATMPGSQSCNAGTGCYWNSCSPTPSDKRWSGSDPALFHDTNCSHDGGDGTWWVNYKPFSIPTCEAQYGPYDSAFAPGVYKVGFRINCTGGGSNAHIDAAVNGGSGVIAQRDVNLASGVNCYELHNVSIVSCAQLEFRVRTLNGLHSVQILDTHVAPDDGGNACN
jgi:hypothetical protein